MWCLIFLIYALTITTRAAPTITEPYAEDMKKRNLIALECIEQVKIDEKVVARAVYNPNDLPTDNKYKEFLACSYKKQKFQSEDGQMLYDNIYDFLSRFYNRSDLKILEKCKTITAEGEEEMAYNSLKCILKNLKFIDVTKTFKSEVNQNINDVS